MASPGNQHCANCIGTLSFPIHTADGQTPRDESDLSADRPDGYRFLQTVIIFFRFVRFPFVGSRRTHNLASYKLSSIARKTVIVYQLKQIVDKCPLRKCEGGRN